MFFFNTFRRCSAAIGLLLLLAATVAGEEASRTWTDVTGRHSVEATLVRFVDGNVTLRKQDGKTVTLALNRLSRADREYVAQTHREIAQPQRVISLSQKMYKIVATADGSTLVTAGHGGVFCFDLETGRQRWHVGEGDEVLYGLAIHGDTVFVGGYSGFFRSLDVRTGEERARFDHGRGAYWPVNDLAVSADGTSVLTGHGDRVCLWNVETQELRRTLAERIKPVYAVAIAPQQNFFAAAQMFTPEGGYQFTENDRLFRLWSSDPNAEAINPFGPSAGSIRDLAYSPNGSYMAFASSIGEVHLYSGSRLRGHLRYRSTSSWLQGSRSRVQHHAHDTMCMGVVFSPSSELLLTCGGCQLNLRRTRNPRSNAPLYLKQDNTMRLWDVATRNELVQFGDGNHTFFDATFLPNGKIAAVTTRFITMKERVHQIQIWSVPENLRTRCYGEATRTASTQRGTTNEE